MTCYLCCHWSVPLCSVALPRSSSGQSVSSQSLSLHDWSEQGLICYSATSELFVLSNWMNLLWVIIMQRSSFSLLFIFTVHHISAFTLLVNGGGTLRKVLWPLTGETRGGLGGDTPSGVQDKAFAAILLQLKQFPKPIILKCLLKHGRVCGLRKQYVRGAKSAMAKAIDGHSMPNSAMAMAIVAIPVALPLLLVR